MQVTGFISWEPPPGILSFAFTDVHGRTHTLYEKSAMTAETIDFEHAQYPRAEEGILECVVLEIDPNSVAAIAATRPVVRIETEALWPSVFRAAMRSLDDCLKAEDPPQVFEVYADQLMTPPPWAGRPAPYPSP